jgi:hypothetical protein
VNQLKLEKIQRLLNDGARVLPGFATISISINKDETERAIGDSVELIFISKQSGARLRVNRRQQQTFHFHRLRSKIFSFK